MKWSIFVLLVLITGGLAKSIPRSKLHDNFAAICDKGQSVIGFSAITSKSAKKSDIRLMLFCKNVDPGRKFKAGKCRDAKQFDFFDGKGSVLANNKFGSASNCKKGEYLAGIKSTYSKGNARRKLQYHCCKANNAQVDETIGCHHVGPKKAFSRNMFLMKNRVFARRTCPQDVMSGMEVTKNGIIIKYCPMKIKGVKYDKACKNMKRKVKTFKETDGSSAGGKKPKKNKKEKRKPEIKKKRNAKLPKEILISPSDTPEVSQGKLTEDGEDFKTECEKGESVDEMVMKIGDSGDLQMKTMCADTKHEGKESEAERTFQTQFFQITDFGKKDGCKKDESFVGIVSQYRDKKRYISIKCVEASNAKLVKGSVEEVRKQLIEEELVFEAEDEKKVVQTIYFEPKGDKITAVLVFAQYENIREPKFSQNKFLDDTEKQLKKQKGKPKPKPTKAPIDEAFVVNEDEGKLKKVSDIPFIKENTYSLAGDDFAMDCGKGFAIHGAQMLTGGGDTIMMYQCKRVLDISSLAEKIRYTEWTELSEMREFSGCEEEETVGGLISQFDPVQQQRIFSLKCVEYSNAVIRPESFAKDVTKELSKEAAIFASTDDFTMTNFYMEVPGDGSKRGHFIYNLFEYSEYAKFTQDVYIDQSLTGPPPESEECICVCSEICDGKEVAVRRAKRAARRRNNWKKKQQKMKKEAYSTIRMRVERENFDGMSTFVLIPSEYVERCPEDQCKCKNSCPVVEQCDVPESMINDRGRSKEKKGKKRKN